jgi:hypothetical protein
LYGAECRIQYGGKDVGNVGISQSFCQVGPMDSSLKTMEHAAKFGCTVLPHPTYSLGFALSDFHLFRPMKAGLSGQHFPDNAVIAVMRECVASTGADLYECSIIAGKNA